MNWNQLTEQQQLSIVNYFQDHPEHQPLGPDLDTVKRWWEEMSQDEQQEILDLQHCIG
jgi:predicted Fe-S protein YdhL (DUF1289 family)